MNLLFWVITCDYAHTDLYYHIQNEERPISYMKNQSCPLEKKREKAKAILSEKRKWCVTAKTRQLCICLESEAGGYRPPLPPSGRGPALFYVRVKCTSCPGLFTNLSWESNTKNVQNASANGETPWKCSAKALLLPFSDPRALHTPCQFWRELSRWHLGPRECLPSLPGSSNCTLALMELWEGYESI